MKYKCKAYCEVTQFKFLHSVSTQNMTWKKYLLDEMEYEETGKQPVKMQKKKTEERSDLRTIRR